MSSRGSTRSALLLPFALLIGATYFVATRADFQGADMVAWKGLGVGLLALWAARHADTADGWTIAAVLALGAAGDVLIETSGLVAGALAFLAGHVLATWLYGRGQWRRGWPIVVTTGAIVSAAGFALTGGPGIAVYAAGLGTMAGAASLRRFGFIVAFGAWLFVISDFLIFARLGPLAGSQVPDWLVWPTYFAGQALIAYGVIHAQADVVVDHRQESRYDDLHHRL